MSDVEHNITRNNITVGDRVIFLGKSYVAPREHVMLASSVLTKGKPYTVSFVFAGIDFEQIELEENPEHAFVHDMFFKVSK